MEAMLAAFTLVFLAEMGDKTQLLVMGLSLRFPWPKVMAGVVLATIGNHLLAGIVGVLCGSCIEGKTVSVAASLLFIIFGLYTLKEAATGEEEAAEESINVSAQHPIKTVAIAFFLAEMGDKTQFATAALAAKYGSLAWIICGTTTAMALADGLGIMVGTVLTRCLPKERIDFISAMIFIAFGVFGLWEIFG